MKVYVDELPKSCKEFGCDNCPYAEIQEINHYFINNEFVSYRDCVCKLDKTCGFKQGEKLCPLKSLSDYTKQVRKEVCEEIKEHFEPNNATIIDENICTPTNQATPIIVGFRYCKKRLLEKLDQIQGENDADKRNGNQGI